MKVVAGGAPHTPAVREHLVVVQDAVRFEGTGVSVSCFNNRTPLAAFLPGYQVDTAATLPEFTTEVEEAEANALLGY